MGKIPDMRLKLQSKSFLDLRLKICKDCKGMNIQGETSNAPGYGDIRSPVFIIGQSLCEDCMDTKIPFTGGSGLILDEVFKQCNIRKEDLFITNQVHCHPPKNRPSRSFEIENCSKFLKAEINIVDPLLIIGLGNEVRQSIMPGVPFNYILKCVNGKFKGRHIVFLYPPAYFYRRGGLKGKETLSYIKLFKSVLERWV